MHGIAALRRIGDWRCELCGEFVFVQEAAESVASADARVAGRSAKRDWPRDRRLLAECAACRNSGSPARKTTYWGPTSPEPRTSFWEQQERKAREITPSGGHVFTKKG